MAGLLVSASVAWISEGHSAAAAAAQLISLDPVFGGPMGSQDAEPSVSGDGNVVVFTAHPPPGTEFGSDWVNVRNRAGGTTTAVPAPFPPDGAATTGGVLSRDGCHVAYWGFSPSFTFNIPIPFPPFIIPIVIPAHWDIYTWDVCTPGATLVLVSTAADFPALISSGDSIGPLAISADGRYVAYVAQTFASGRRIARIDTSGAIVESQFFLGPGNPNSIDISDNGAFLAVGGDVTINDSTHAVVMGWSPPCAVGVAVVCNTQLLSVNDGGQVLSGSSSNPSLSADGRYVAFMSDSADIVSLPDGVLTTEVYVRDRTAGTTRLVTDTPGSPMDGRVDEPEISPDGTQVVLQRRASDFAPVAADVAEIYVARSTSGSFDTSVFDLVSYGVNGSPTSKDSTVPSMSSNGRYVAFASFANDELAGTGMPLDENVWMRERPIALDITPTVDFGTVNVGAQSAPQNAVVRNTSGVPINIAAVTPPAAPFAVTSNGCGGSLAPGATCAVTIVFSPTASGSASSTVTVAGDGLSVSASLVGAGRGATVVPGSLAIAPASANYGTVAVGASVAAKQFVVSNPGQTAVPLAGVALSGSAADQFAIGANTCSGSLGPGATCTVEVAATVTREGSMSATLGALGTGGQAAQATLRVRGTSVPVVFTPTLKMNPGVVSPGEVTAAIGAGFPPNIDVQLAFAGEPPLAAVHTDASGAFRFDYLLLRNGIRVGGREIVVIDQADFSGVRAPLLIDLATFRPSGFSSPAITAGVRSLFRGG
ncbi:MAG: choice-of-anchor D domain-containing protein [Ilumatobacteraceae bacterium]